MINSWLDKVFHTASEAFQNCLKRFPVTVCFIFALTAYLIYLVSIQQLSQSQAALLYYLSVGTLLSLTLHLWSEEIKRKTYKLATHLIGHTLLIADALFLAYGALDNSMLEIGIAHTAGVFTVGISVFFLSFLKDKNDVPSWNFAMHSFNLFVVSVFIGWIMFGSISLLISSLHVLFNIHIPSDYYLYLGIICCIWLSLMLFIGRLPQGIEKHNTEVLSSSFLNSIITYLFLPLTAGYLLVLYIYAIQIMIAWKLPNGWVSWLIIAVMAICIIIEFSLYPTRITEKKSRNEIIARWLPILILPLLLLMTIGIIRRISDYGISINRLYLITLNGWFYVVCIGLFINKVQRINWIPISFSLLFLLTSALPINYANITKKSIHKHVKEEIEASHKPQLPMDNETYLDWLETLPLQQAIRINSRLAYLSSRFGHNSFSDILKDPNAVYNDYYYNNNAADTVVTEDIPTSVSTADSTQIQLFQWRGSQYNKVKIPEGYTAFYNITNYTTVISQDQLQDSILRIDILIDSAINDTIFFDKATLMRLYAQGMNAKAKVFSCQSDKHKFRLTSFSLQKEPDDTSLWTFSYSGYLFKK